MYYPMFYIDPLYIILVGPALIFTGWAQWKVTSTYKKWRQYGNSRGMTGAQAAKYMMEQNGIYDVDIQMIGGELTDNYNPTNKVVSLSSDIYNGTSIAAIGIACHEVGHVVQHHVGYFPIKVRNAIIPITNIGATLAIPLIILGLILNVVNLAWLGVLCFGLSTLFQLITLPVEFNASHRALQTIDSCGLFTGTDYRGAKAVLTAAALTYVAALFVSLMQLLRWVIIIGGNSRDD
ncbi:MAG: zinc metallopeptidase [Absicoccus porci]|uniref:zinc metallopeptidase n=1 Tax=Absicoccus porci TaxID=2486576 RepID=UPI002E77B25A|nr:zinc metallopeptidase [Absicoccus porci]MEE1355889.1 zinc metallopeptidase [Absicoccus porci]